MKLQLNTLTLLTAFLMSAWLFASCSGQDEPVMPSESGVDPDDVISMSLRLPFTGASSRADNQGHPEVPSDFPSFEDYINPDDICIMMFLGDSDAAPRIFKWVGYNHTNDESFSMTNDGSVYTVKFSLSRVEFLKLKPGLDISPGSSELIKLRVVVVANESINKGTMTYDLPYKKYDLCTTYGSFFETAEKKSFSLGTGFYPENGPLTSTIPMFGMRLFEIKCSDLYKTSPENVTDLGEIYLLRSLVKVRLLDETDKPDGIYPMISDVKPELDDEGNPKYDDKGNPIQTQAGLVYRYRMANYLPYDAKNLINGFQVGNINPTTPNSGTLKPGGNVKNTDKNDPKEVYASYCPDQKVDENSGIKYPNFSFYYKLSDTSDWQEMTVPMTGTELPDGSRGFIRNHIYSIVVRNDAPVARSADGGSGISVSMTESQW